VRAILTGAADENEGRCHRRNPEAEGAGFEPAVRGHRTPVFKTGAFDRSATPPAAHDATRLRLYTGLHSGEVAEWLKALAC
jgi:hypothetical protein